MLYEKLAQGKEKIEYDFLIINKWGLDELTKHMNINVTSSQQQTRQTKTIRYIHTNKIKWIKENPLESEDNRSFE